MSFLFTSSYRYLPAFLVLASGIITHNSLFPFFYYFYDDTRYLTYTRSHKLHTLHLFWLLILRLWCDHTEQIGVSIPLHARAIRSINYRYRTNFASVRYLPCRPDSGCKSNAQNFEPNCHINLYCCHPCRFAIGCDLKNVAKLKFFSDKMFVATNTSVQRGAASLLSSAARYLPTVPAVPTCNCLYLLYLPVPTCTCCT